MTQNLNGAIQELEKSLAGQKYYLIFKDGGCYQLKTNDDSIPLNVTAFSFKIEGGVEWVDYAVVAEPEIIFGEVVDSHFNRIVLWLPKEKVTAYVDISGDACEYFSKNKLIEGDFLKLKIPRDRIKKSEYALVADVFSAKEIIEHTRFQECEISLKG